MFYSLTGNVVYTDDQCAAIQCGGVAFKCFTTRSTLAAIHGQTGDVTLYTYLSVREDALDLYGFYTQQELDAFKLLINVNGVGAKMAVSILSNLDAQSLAVAIASGDVKAITVAQGVGTKLAQRVIMELKDKFVNAGFVSESTGIDAGAAAAAGSMSNTAEAIAALTALGYSRSEASVAVGKLDPSLGVEELIKLALKNMTLRF